MAKYGFKSVISIFCCSVSVGNISCHFQIHFAVNCNNPVFVCVSQQPCVKTEKTDLHPGEKHCNNQEVKK